MSAAPPHPTVERVRAALVSGGDAEAAAAIRQVAHSTRTAAEAAAVLGTTVGRIAKSLLFLAAGEGGAGEDQGVLVIASGANRVSEAKLARRLGRAVRRADAATVKRLTGYAVGGVPPLGHVTPLRVLVDRDLLRYPEVWAAAGTPYAVFPIAPDRLVRVAGGEVADVADVADAGAPGDAPAADAAADLALLRRLDDNASGAAARGREVIDCGPFRALLDPESDLVWINYAVPTVHPLPDAAAAVAAVERLRAVFGARRRRLRFEFTAGVWPALPGLLEGAGLTLQARHPLLRCTPASFAPLAAPGVAVHRLGADADDLLGTFLTVRDRGFGDLVGPAPERAPDAAVVAGLAREIGAGHLRAVLATLDGAPAGVGVTLPLAGVAELAGVTTLPDLRRRGVAATLSSALVADCFGAGVDLVWLSAGDDRARRVYERIGFRVCGERLNYIAPAAGAAGAPPL